MCVCVCHNLFLSDDSLGSEALPARLLARRPRFTHAHRDRDHVFHTLRPHARFVRGATRSYARVSAGPLRVCALVRARVTALRGSRRSSRSESRPSHTCSFFPRDRFAPQPPLLPRTSSATLGSFRSLTSIDSARGGGIDSSLPPYRFPTSLISSPPLFSSLLFASLLGSKLSVALRVTSVQSLRFEICDEMRNF